MKTIENDLIVPIDTDLTLIDYNIDDKNPNDLVEVGLIPGKTIKIYPIKEHIQTLKNMKASGAYILVWSGTGHAWAAHIVKKLGLEDYVDVIMSKPKWYIDDCPADEWMKRMYRYKPYIRK